MSDEPEATSSSSEAETERMRDRIIQTLKTVYDPEIPVDIYEMGLIYRVDIKEVDDDNKHPVDVIMTLTTPMCPVAETLPPEVEQKVRSVEGVGEVHLDLVWDPPWSPDMMSETAKLALNM